MHLIENKLFHHNPNIVSIANCKLLVGVHSIHDLATHRFITSQDCRFPRTKWPCKQTYFLLMFEFLMSLTSLNMPSSIQCIPCLISWSMLSFLAKQLVYFSFDLLEANTHLQMITSILTYVLVSACPKQFPCQGA